MKKFLAILLAVLMMFCFVISMVGCASHNCTICGKSGASHKFSLLGQEIWYCDDCAKAAGIK